MLPLIKYSKILWSAFQIMEELLTTSPNSCFDVYIIATKAFIIYLSGNYLCCL